MVLAEIDSEGVATVHIDVTEFDSSALSAKSASTTASVVAVAARIVRVVFGNLETNRLRRKEALVAAGN